MDADALIDRLERGPDAIRSLVAVIAPEDHTWRPDPDSWSAREIVCHLADEETDDFRVRLRLVLEDPSKDWPGIDPQGWETERVYAEKSLESELDRFTQERRDSIAWLRSLRSPDWSVSKHHTLGAMSAGDLLGAWAAHDALHLRQLARRVYQLSERDASPGRIGYAGDW